MEVEKETMEISVQVNRDLPRIPGDSSGLGLTGCGAVVIGWNVGAHTVPSYGPISVTCGMAPGS